MRLKDLANRNLSLTFVVVLLSSCSEGVNQKLNDSGFGEKAQIGAVTGGALGGGLGAVVGSQTGSGGAGLVVGAAAGALAGSAIGKTLDDVDAAFSSRDEVIRRHEAEIAVNRAQIEELRSLGQDQVSYSRKKVQPDRDVLPSEIPKLPINSSRVISPRRLEAKPLERSHPSRLPSSIFDSRESPRASLSGVEKAPVIVARGDKISSTALPSSRGKLEKDGGASKRVVDVADHGDDHRDFEREIVVNSSNKKSDKPSLEIAKKQPSKELFGDDSSKLPGGHTPNKSGAIAGIPAHSVKALPQQPAVVKTRAEECLSAEDEMTRADELRESADKLFHYRRALRLCPTNPAYHNKLGELYLALGRREDAHKEFSEAASLNPNFKLAAENMRTMGSSH